MQQDLLVSGYMTRAKLKDDRLQYSISSLLAGSFDKIECWPESVGPDGFSGIDCVGLSAGESALIADRFNDATVSYAGFLDGIGIRDNRVVLVPVGVGYRKAARFSKDPAELAIELGIRYAPGNETLLRNGIRIYVHELVHLNRKASKWNISKDREEYLASLMESCVEVDVFGDSKGYVLEGDLNLAGSKGLSAAQDRSIKGFAAAYRDVRSYMRGTGSVRRSDGSFGLFCRQAFKAVTAGPGRVE